MILPAISNAVKFFPTSCYLMKLTEIIAWRSSTETMFLDLKVQKKKTDLLMACLSPQIINGRYCFPGRRQWCDRAVDPLHRREHLV